MMNILIIEDNIKMAGNIATVLRHENYNADIALTIEDGRYKASVNNYNIIILDLNLPDGDGLDVCKDLNVVMLWGIGGGKIQSSSWLTENF